jgi:glucose/arabinose dehydrogenase
MIMAICSKRSINWSSTANLGIAGTLICAFGIVSCSFSPANTTSTLQQVQGNASSEQASTPTQNSTTPSTTVADAKPAPEICQTPVIKGLERPWGMAT